MLSALGDILVQGETRIHSSVAIDIYFRCYAKNKHEMIGRFSSLCGFYLNGVIVNTSTTFPLSSLPKPPLQKKNCNLRKKSHHILSFPGNLQAAANILWEVLETARYMENVEERSRFLQQLFQLICNEVKAAGAAGLVEAEEKGMCVSVCLSVLFFLSESSRKRE